jgi:alkaline phosphatase
LFGIWNSRVFRTGSVPGQFVTSDHTGTPAPIFSYGPGSNRLTGFIDNSEIMGKVLSLFE